MCSQYALATDLEQFPHSLKKTLPQGFKEHYVHQQLIRPSDPVLVLKQEHGKTTSSLMLWGLIAEWSQDPINGPRPFNARAETLTTKPSFKAGWRHRRCLLLASAYFEKGYRIRRADSQPFWLAGIWNRWLGADGSEIESCTILTTGPNSLIKRLHNRMPVIIPNGLEESWLAQTDGHDLRALEPLLNGVSPDGWLAESINTRPQMGEQISLF